MVWIIAFGSPDNFVMGPKFYTSKFKPTNQTFGTVTTPAAKTELIGLPADGTATKLNRRAVLQHT